MPNGNAPSIEPARTSTAFVQALNLGYLVPADIATAANLAVPVRSSALAIILAATAPSASKNTLNGGLPLVN
ncbi:unnamed protein product [Clonostachys rosea]|uniref:Uncharacterized protein n=1 Tax=Bionectria ochroleuca TaxID=29856 RepID=A0ABY6U9C2_BIOOC|nr:unnamed protein product [Clonostachys rosea]